eukprot:s2502_g5.t1
MSDTEPAEAPEPRHIHTHANTSLVPGCAAVAGAWHAAHGYGGPLAVADATSAGVGKVSEALGTCYFHTPP